MALIQSGALPLSAFSSGLSTNPVHVAPGTIVLAATSSLLTNPFKVAPGTALLASTSSLAVNATIPLNIAPTVKATNNSQNSTDGVSHVVSLPAGIVAGETLVVLFEFGQTGIAPATFAAYTATASGWNSISDTRGTGSVTNDAHGLIVFQRIADGSEGATVTVTTNNSVRSTHHAYRVASCTGKVEVSTTFATDAVDPYQFDPPNLAPSWGNSDYLIIAALGSCTENPTGFSIPSGYSTPINNQSSWSELTSCFRRVQNVSSEDPGVFSLTGGATTTGGIAATIIFEALECAATLSLSSDLSANLITPAVAWQGTAVFAETSTLSLLIFQRWVTNPAVLPATASVIANTIQNFQAIAVLPATSSLALNALGFHFATTVLPGTSALVCDTKVYSPALATLPCNSTLSATASIALRATATIPLSSDLSVNSQIAFVSRATLPLNSSLAANAAPQIFAAFATLPLNSNLSCVMFGTQQITTVLAASSSIAAYAAQRWVTNPATLPLNGDTAVDTIIKGQVSASASLPLTGTLSAVAKQVWASQSVLTPSANVSCFAAQVWTSLATLTATSNLLCGSVQRWAAIAQFNNASTLSCIGSQWWSSKATLPLISSLIANSQIIVPIQASAALPCNSSLQAKAGQWWLAFSNLKADSNIRVDSDVQSATNVFPHLAATSSLSVNATRIKVTFHWKRHIVASGSVKSSKLRGAVTRPNLTGEVS